MLQLTNKDFTNFFTILAKYDITILSRGETMKVAVLSDIHANIVALEEVLKDAKQQEVEEYIVLGDIVTDLPFTNETIDVIKQLTPYVIKGNRETYLLTYEQTKKDEKWKTMQYQSMICYYNHMREENREYIRNLPENLVLEFEGVKIRAVHGSPYEVSELLYFHTKRMDKVFEDLEEDVLVYGHNHEIAEYETRNHKTVVQVGTLGMHNSTSKAQYVILTCEEKKVSVEIRDIEYDKEKLKNRIIQSGGLYPEARIWQNLCYYSIASGIDIRTDFCQMAKEEMMKKYKGKYPKGFDSHFVSFDDDIYRRVANQFEKYFFL